MKTAEQIKEEMREQVEEHNARVAERTAYAALKEVGGAVDEVLNDRHFGHDVYLTRERVDALLEQLAPYLALLAEVAPTLPTRADVRAQVAEAAE
jgi:uncharacterized membrane protein YGL010W